MDITSLYCNGIECWLLTNINFPDIALQPNNNQPQVV